MKYVSKPLTEQEWLETYAPNHTPIAEEPRSADMCTQCKLHCEVNSLPWPPCKNTDLNRQYTFDKLVRSGAMDAFTEDQQLELQLELDPVLWCMSEFSFDGKPWEPFWYQKIFMRCTAKKRAAMWGRRTGKSECVIALLLHHAKFRTGSKSKDREYWIQIFTNSESLTKKHWEEMRKFINCSRTLAPMFKGGEKGKTIKLTNNVTIVFNVLSDKQLGQDANIMWFDEAAFYEDDSAFAQAMAIGMNNGAPVIMTSNSSGFRGRFHNFCHEKDTYVLQLPSYVHPNWNLEKEVQAHQSFNSVEYDLFVRAEWGESQSGVFSPSDVQYCLKSFEYGRGDCNIQKAPGSYRVLGCDWNEAANGVHFVVVEFNEKLAPEGKPLFRVVHKQVVKGNDFNHEVALQKAYEILMTWACDAAYLDHGGGGSLSVEHLVTRLIKNGHSKMASKIVAIPMAANFQVPDFGGGMRVKKAKNLITGICQILCENHQLAWPAEEAEDTGQEMKNTNIIPQMLAYKVDHTDASGRAIYTTEGTEDHTLTAWLLAVYGCVVNKTGLVVSQEPSDISLVPREPMPTEKAISPKKDKPKSEYEPPQPARARMPGWHLPGMGHRTGGFGKGNKRTW